MRTNGPEVILIDKQAFHKWNEHNQFFDEEMLSEVFLTSGS